MFKLGFIDEATQQLRMQERNLTIIFLDIDGVIYDCDAHRRRLELGQIVHEALETHPLIAGKVPKETVEFLKDDLTSAQGFSQQALANVRDLCETCNAKIVISSAWREKRTVEQLKIVFSLSGLSDYILDATPKCHNRGEEIEAWLSKHARIVKSFVILDDVDNKISSRFGERFVHCKTLFADDALYQKASAILAQPMHYQKSEAIVCWNALAQKSPQLTKVLINSVTITSLKLYFCCDAQSLFDSLFLALANNTQIKHLSLQSFHEHEKAIGFLKRMSELLLNGQMKLDYLNIAHNQLEDITVLLEAIETRKLHIPHLCFNANPLDKEKQAALASWIKSYPMPIKLDLDLSDSGWGRYQLHRDVIDAIIINDRVTVHTREEVLPESVDDERVQALRSAGRLEVDKNEERCCIM